MQNFSIRWQDAMTMKDWLMMGILVVVSAGLWMWVMSEYNKPIVDPEWVSSHVSATEPQSRTEDGSITNSAS
jgi:hypothetical protein